MNDETTVEMTETPPEASDNIEDQATYDSGEAEAATSSEQADATNSETSHEESEPSNGDEATAKPNRVQERFNEMTAARRQAEREAAHWKEQALKHAEQAQPEQQPQPQQQGEPSLEQFNDYDDYVVAKAEYRIQQKLIQSQQQRQQQVKQQQYEETVKTFQSRANEARAKYEDFDVVAFNPNLPVNETMEQVILSDDKGPELAYYLGDNPQEAARIAAMPNPYQQVMELAGIKAKISAPPKPTSAPEPITPIENGKTVNEVDDGPMGATFE